MRWGSTYLMLVHALRLKHIIINYIRHADGMSEKAAAGLQALTITESQWLALEELRDFLQPFHSVTLAAEGSSYPTISRVVPQFNELLDSLERLRDRVYPPTSQIMKVCVEVAMEKLQEYYGSSKDELWVATFLDPSFKIGYFQMGTEGMGEEEGSGHVVGAQHVGANQILELVREKVRPYKEKALEAKRKREGTGGGGGAGRGRGETGSVGASSSNGRQGGGGGSRSGSRLATDVFGGAVGDKMCLVARLAAFRSRQEQTTRDEVQIYIDEQMEPLELCPLAYWRRRNDLESLQAMALDYLAIPATSAASERTFSQGRNLITWQRHRLGPERVEACFILKSWVDLKPGCKLGKEAKDLQAKAEKDAVGLEIDDE
ncbi:unnamed protein product [Closterium sp. Naga37s-1]|nr:unnamed protein product [Closterium sp. Naga37s-1]